MGALPSEELAWERFFANPSLWWDNRARKRSSGCPDFTHSSTGECLWIHSRLSPSWVAAKLSAHDRQQRGWLVTAIQECGRLKQLHAGREIHRRILDRDRDLEASLASSLLQMYVRCGNMLDARRVFEGMRHRNAAAWNSMLVGYVDDGQAEAALEIFHRMLQRRESEGGGPDRVAYLAALKACVKLAGEEQGAASSIAGKVAVKAKSLATGMIIHSHARSSGIDKHRFVASRLVSMYAKCGSMEDARRVFDEMVERDAVSWNCIIMGYAECGAGDLALELFCQMQQQHEKLKPTSVTYLAALKACASVAAGESSQLIDAELVKLRSLEAVRRVHSAASLSGHACDVFVASSLVDVYCKCGSLRESRLVFDAMSNRTLVSWTTMILGYADNRHGEVALELYSEMLKQGFTPNYVTYVAALKACSSLADGEAAVLLDGKMVKLRSLTRGREIHRHACQSSRQDIHIFVANSVLDMYSKCGSLEEARRVFESIPERSVVSWTGMILGYAENGDGATAMELYSRMQDEGCARDAVVVMAAVKACSAMAVLQAIEFLESETMENCCLGGCLVDMFAKCGSMADASEIFEKMPRRDIASWNSLVMGYAESGEAELSLKQHLRMLQEDQVVADAVSYVAALKACPCLADEKNNDEKIALQACKVVHGRAARAGFELHTLVANTLIDAYAKCGSMNDSWRVFESMRDQSAVSWSAIVLGYVQAGDGKLALESYRQMMEHDGVKFDAVTFIAALKACRTDAAVESGRAIEAQVRAATASVIPAVANCLIDFYGKCGSMLEARQVFDSMNSRDRQLITWNALIDGYSRQGDFEQVLLLFEEMQRQLFEPNDVTFVSILAAASHAGLVDRGKECFELMSSKYGIDPNAKHYACMVDLLGRANRLDEALAIASNMPHNSNSVVWMALLSACHKWENVRIGRIAFESTVRVEKNPVAACVLMSNLYAAAGMWEESRAIKA